MTTTARRFVEEFRARHGRAPRILHVGNIVNNAYLNATLLNRCGFDCDVVCYDQYHMMSYPEWEQDFQGEVGDHYRPDWTSVSPRGFRRPRWFAQGPRDLCIEYLIARRTGRWLRAYRLWRELGWANRTRSEQRDAWVRRWSTLALQSRAAAERMRATRNSLAYRLSYIRNLREPYRKLWRKVGEWGRKGVPGLLVYVIAPLAVLLLFLLRLGPRPAQSSQVAWAPGPGQPGWSTTWPARFAAAFPERRDRLTDDDCYPYMLDVPAWRRLFEHYDIVQAYATEVVLPLLAEKRPYIGYEHGTLREFVLPDDPICRLTALGYNQADQVFITNGDCLEYAHAIKVPSYLPMLHPFDDEIIARAVDDSDRLRAHYGVKHLFLCPLRHDWAVKGTDGYIRALPALAAAIGRDFRVIMTRYGKELDRSLALAEELGVVDLVAWIGPLNRIQLLRHMRSVDIVFDQLAVPAFGGTAPQALALGVPVIMSYDPAVTQWIIPEPAPILAARSTEEIVAAVIRALGPSWRHSYKTTAQQWYRTHHSSARVVELHAQAYRDICRSTGLLPVDRAATPDAA